MLVYYQCHHSSLTITSIISLSITCPDKVRTESGHHRRFENYKYFNHTHNYSDNFLWVEFHKCGYFTWDSHLHNTVLHRIDSVFEVEQVEFYLHNYTDFSIYKKVKILQKNKKDLA